MPTMGDPLESEQTSIQLRGFSPPIFCCKRLGWFWGLNMMGKPWILTHEKGISTNMGCSTGLVTVGFPLSEPQGATTGIGDRSLDTFHTFPCFVACDLKNGPLIHKPSAAKLGDTSLGANDCLQINHHSVSQGLCNIPIERIRNSFRYPP